MSGSGVPEDGLAEVIGLMLDFLVSKSLVASERTLRNELQVLINSAESAGGGDKAVARWRKTVRAHNVYTSELERRLNVDIPLQKDHSTSPAVVDVTPVHAACSKQPRGDDDAPRLPQRPAVSDNARVALYDHVQVGPEDESRLRQRRGVGTPQQRVVFHDPAAMPAAIAETLAHISLPLLYNPHVNGLEDQPELLLPVGGLIAGRYRVTANIGKGSFSKVYQCHDQHCKRMVSVKVLRNDKDCLDAGLGEVKMLALTRKHDPSARQPLVGLRDYFYYKEHLLIVTELLRDSLFQVLT